MLVERPRRAQAALEELRGATCSTGDAVSRFDAHATQTVGRTSHQVPQLCTRER